MFSNVTGIVTGEAVSSASCSEHWCGTSRQKVGKFHPFARVAAALFSLVVESVECFLGSLLVSHRLDSTPL